MMVSCIQYSKAVVKRKIINIEKCLRCQGQYLAKCLPLDTVLDKKYFKHKNLSNPGYSRVLNDFFMRNDRSSKKFSKSKAENLSNDQSLRMLLVHWFISLCCLCVKDKLSQLHLDYQPIYKMGFQSIDRSILGSPVE